MAEAELSELRSSLVTREEQLEAVKQARHLVITLLLHNFLRGDRHVSKQASLTLTRRRRCRA